MWATSVLYFELRLAAARARFGPSDGSGKEASRVQSTAFFETDKDPVFAQALDSADG